MSGDKFHRKPFYLQYQDRQQMQLIVCPTTGGKIQLSVSSLDSVDGLKCLLARKFRLHKHKLSLLFKDRVLVNGTLRDNHLVNGSEVRLLPNMETGTTNMTPDSRVMQALENLSDTQVNDFLTGRAPLFLAMKLGEHMMFVQLQLSTCNSRRRHSAMYGNSHPSAPHNAPCSCHRVPETTRTSPTPYSAPVNPPGAVIDSVSHLGQGVYSGTFSGTLDPTLQDHDGKPKRDISTILHILNDLLVASPQFRNQSMYTGHSPGQQVPLHQTNIGQTGLGNHCRETDDNTALRGKVRDLQRMLAERKMRRQEKRGMVAPYSWSSRQSSTRKELKKASRKNFEQSVCRDTNVSKSENHANQDAPFSSTATNMEHESVLV